MITYEMVKRAMIDPPQEALVDLYNELGDYITDHEKCINDENPFPKLGKKGSFCLSAASIQSNYIGFVLGKSVASVFPPDLIDKIFNLGHKYNVQYANITGRQINGCLVVVHMEDSPCDLQMVYDKIYGD